MFITIDGSNFKKLGSINRDDCMKTLIQVIKTTKFLKFGVADTSWEFEFHAVV